jgi:putative transposase
MIFRPLPVPPQWNGSGGGSQNSERKGERYNSIMSSQQRVPRLKRLDRLFVSNPVYFITACTEKRRMLLANAGMHESFRRFCEEGLTRGVFVGKYVLMPDHLHLFVTLGEEYKSAVERCNEDPVAAVCDRRIFPLSDWMKSLKNSLSKTLRQMGVAAPHWQKGFFDHVMRSEESYSAKWVYVSENPLRKKLVDRAEEWPYQGEIYPLQARGHVL